MKKSFAIAGLLAISGALSVIPAAAQTPPDAVRIGAIADLTGSYSAFTGEGVAAAMRMAAEDFGGKVLGKPIEILSGDSLQKADVASIKARQWFDRDGVAMVFEASDSASTLAVQKLGAEKKRITIHAAGPSAIVNSECTPFSAQWVYNTYAIANTVGPAVTAEGGDSWFFVSVDYAFGKVMEAETTAAVKASGGTVVGSVKHPFGASDFASFLMTAQASNAKVVALANGGSDTQNALRQAREFNVANGNTRVVPLIMFDTDVKGMGLEVTQGMSFATAFYWDRNEETRSWSNRFYKVRNAMPTMAHAGAYSATLHYLKAVEAAGTLDAAAVMEQMKKAPVQDVFASNGKLRADGLMEHDMYLVQVKSPADSKGPWDLFTVRRTIPGAQAYHSLAASTCPLVKK